MWGGNQLPDTITNSTRAKITLLKNLIKETRENFQKNLITLSGY
jgi:hypothetical protein